MEESDERDKATGDVRGEDSTNYNERTTNGKDVIRTEHSEAVTSAQLQGARAAMNLFCDYIKGIQSSGLGDAAVAELCALMEKGQQTVNAALSNQNEPCLNALPDSKSFEGSNPNDNDVSPAYNLKQVELDIPHSYPKMDSDMIENIRQHYKEIEGMSNKASIGIARDSMIDLSSGKELYSDIVDEKMKLIEARSKNASGNLPSVFVLPYEVFCFLYNYEEQEALSLALSYGHVDVYNMLMCNLIMFPLHFSQCTNHWALAVVDMRADHCVVVKYYDSIIQRGYQDQIVRAYKSLTLIQKYLELARKKSAVVGDVLSREWKFEIPEGVPQQAADNDVDCGVFILKFADYLSYGKELNFSQSHIPYFRKVIAWELLNKRMFLMPQQATIVVN